MNFSIKPILIFSAIFLLLLSPRMLWAVCDPNDDGDCCKQDNDCGAFFHPALCAVIPLNKVTIAKLEKENLQRPDFCDQHISDQLRLDVATKKPKCFDYGCEFDEDNG